MAKKYKPKVGDEIDFSYKKESHVGTIMWIGQSHITVYPHTVSIKTPAGLDIESEWVVEYSEIKGRTKDGK